MLFASANCAPVARAIARALAPGGVALVSDPARPSADGFEACCEAAGLRCGARAELHHVRFGGDGGDGGVLKQAALYVLTRRDDADELAERAARVGAAAERAWTALQATQHAPEFEGRVSGFAYTEAFSSGD